MYNRIKKKKCKNDNIKSHDKRHIEYALFFSLEGTNVTNIV